VGPLTVRTNDMMIHETLGLTLRSTTNRYPNTTYTYLMLRTPKKVIKTRYLKAPYLLLTFISTSGKDLAYLTVRVGLPNG